MKNRITRLSNFIHPNSRMFTRGMQVAIAFMDKQNEMEYNRFTNNQKLLPEND